MKITCTKVEDGAVILTANPMVEGLPVYQARICMVPGTEDIYEAWIFDAAREDGTRIEMTFFGRGNAFVDCVVRHAPKGVYSRLGKHRRMTANRAARKAQVSEGGEA